jgi:hypothetical protein
LLESTTYEEANCRLGNWIRQRSRWVKGYIQTWLVHMRDPLRLRRELGTKNWLSFQLMVGGTVFVLLLNPLFWAVAILWIATQASAIREIFPGFVYFVGSFNLLIGNFAFGYLGVAGVLRRGYDNLAKWVLLSPLYWLLMSVAAWKGFFQLFRRPHYWEKTVHGLAYPEQPPSRALPANSALPRSVEAPAVEGVSPAGPRLFIPARESSSWRRISTSALTFGRSESLVLFAAVYSVYAGVGLYVTLRLHLVEEDAQSRLAHAYFALWNKPAKLAAIGVYWPPLQTVVFLPFAALRPLATSLAALPLSSALFAAGVVVVINRALAFSGLRRGLRLALVSAYALNPLILFYGSNGMAEIIYLLLLTAALAVFVRWTLAPHWAYLLSIGALLALGVLARFEVAFWVPIVAGGVVLVHMAQRARLSTIVASTLVVVVPVAYAIATWLFINWSLHGDPLAFVAAHRFKDLPVSILGRCVAPHASRGLSSIAMPHSVIEAASPSGPGSISEIANALWLQFAVFPATYVIAGALLVYAALRRNVVAPVLSAALLLNGVSTAGWALLGGQGAELQLRYNLRALPLAVIAGGWLLTVLPRRVRTLAAVMLLGALVASSVLTAKTMLDYRNAKGESAFIEGLRTGRDQDGVPQPEGTGTSMRDIGLMAHYIRAHVHGKDVVLTDDAQTFGVMLADGHPGRYFDRIDAGDTKWKEILDDPVPRVRYLLVQNYVGFRPFDRDLAVDRYPNLVSCPQHPPFVRRLLRATPGYALFSLYGHRVLWGRGSDGRPIAWYREPALASYLATRGITWPGWQARHVAAARVLESQSGFYPEARPPMAFARSRA